MASIRTLLAPALSSTFETIMAVAPERYKSSMSRMSFPATRLVSVCLHGVPVQGVRVKKRRAR
jgi:hypothetical protein